jgi:NADH-quinone oxidoreductase subunit H
VDLITLSIEIAKILGVIFILLNVGGLMTWVERKQAAVIQHRIGANRAGFLLPRRVEGGPLWIRLLLNPLLFFLAPLLNPVLKVLTVLGLLHPLADGVKLLLKEDVPPPRGANPVLYQLAPLLAFIPIFLVAALIPFGPPLRIGERVIPLQIAPIDAGILAVFAFGGLGIYAAAIGGWASNNKFALLGSLRASAQMISYELALGLSAVGIFMVYGTVRLEEMIERQGALLWGWIPAWGIFLQPLAFFLFYAAILAEGKRVPFDLPEGESEIVAGYFLEYSGMKFGIYYLAEFVEVFLASMLVTVLFFGGWHIPYLTDQGFVFPGGLLIPLSPTLVYLLRIGAFIAKIIFFTWFNVQIRWTLLRFRFDQLLRLGWANLVPLALINILVTGIFLLGLQKGA